jgi:2-oxoisovalerate dehydrogenase E1 component beta subunit
MAEMTLVEAVTTALARALADDPRTVVLGQDVGRKGGVFQATAGLYERFGPARVRDTPLAETMIAGLAVGMSTHGLVPIAEIQFMGFLYPCLDNLANHAARMRTRTRGRLSCPLVVRTTHGGRVHAPEHHSDAIESMLAHVPGLRVVIASTPCDAYRLLLAAIRDPDPVVFLEPTRLYRAYREEVPDDGIAGELDRCALRREGDDITLVSWGASMTEALAAADALAQEGVAATVVDVRTLAPLDATGVLDAVRRTGRCVIVHEGARRAGFGAEIAAEIAEHAATSLLAPVQRVTGYDVVVPLPRLEDAYFPGTGRVLEACRRSLAYA